MFLDPFEQSYCCWKLLYVYQTLFVAYVDVVHNHVHTHKHKHTHSKFKK